MEKSSSSLSPPRLKFGEVGSNMIRTMRETLEILPTYVFLFHNNSRQILLGRSQQGLNCLAYPPRSSPRSGRPPLPEPPKRRASLELDPSPIRSKSLERSRFLHVEQGNMRLHFNRVLKERNTCLLLFSSGCCFSPLAIASSRILYDKDVKLGKFLSPVWNWNVIYLLLFSIQKFLNLLQ